MSASLLALLAAPASAPPTAAAAAASSEPCFAPRPGVSLSLGGRSARLVLPEPAASSPAVAAGKPPTSLPTVVRCRRGVGRDSDWACVCARMQGGGGEVGFLAGDDTVVAAFAPSSGVARTAAARIKMDNAGTHASEDGDLIAVALSLFQGRPAAWFFRNGTLLADRGLPVALDESRDKELVPFALLSRPGDVVTLVVVGEGDDTHRALRDQVFKLELAAIEAEQAISPAMPGSAAREALLDRLVRDFLSRRGYLETLQRLSMGDADADPARNEGLVQRHRLCSLLMDGQAMQALETAEEALPHSMRRDSRAGIELRVQVFVEFLRQEDFERAVAYARRELWPCMEATRSRATSTSHGDKRVRHALALLASPRPMESEHKEYFSNKRRRYVADLVCDAVMGMEDSPPLLEVALQRFVTANHTLREHVNGGFGVPLTDGSLVPQL